MTWISHDGPERSVGWRPVAESRDEGGSVTMVEQAPSDGDEIADRLLALFAADLTESQIASSGRPEPPPAGLAQPPQAVPDPEVRASPAAPASAMEPSGPTVGAATPLPGASSAAGHPPPRHSPCSPASYLPLAGAALVASPTGTELRLPGGAGAAVYAVAGGTVTGAPPILRGDDGRGYRYGGMRWLAADGARVVAGQAIGVLEPHPHDGTPAATCLHLAVTGPDGTRLDTYRLLAGLVDPVESAWWAVDDSVDPELAPWAGGGLDSPVPTGAWSSASATAAPGLPARSADAASGSDLGEPVGLAALLVADEVRPAGQTGPGDAG